MPRTPVLGPDPPRSGPDHDLPGMIAICLLPPVGPNYGPEPVQVPSHAERF